MAGREEGWHGNALVATIGVAGALLGAVVGGWTNRMAADDAADRQEQVLHDREMRAARGVAAVMLADLEHGLARLCAVGKTGFYLRIAPRLPSQISQADRQLLAAYLTPEGWRTVADADLRLDDWWQLYRVNIGQRAAVVKDGLPEIVRRVTAARRPLGSLARIRVPGRPEACDVRTWQANAAGGQVDASAPLGRAP